MLFCRTYLCARCFQQQSVHQIHWPNSAFPVYDRHLSMPPNKLDLLLLLCLLCWAALQSVSAQSPATAVTAAAAPPAAGATAGAAVCSLSLVGFGDRLGIKSAKLSCTGGTITVAAHKVLEDFWGQKKAMPGVVWGDSKCIGNTACLITVCGSSSAVFESATVTSLRGGVLTWGLAVCVNR